MSATPINNKEYLWSYREEALEVIRAAKAKKGLTYEQIAKELGVSEAWIASAFLGQQFVPPAYAEKLAKLLDLTNDEVATLTTHPYKGNVDPILYRLHEVFDTFGPTIKEIIHEKFPEMGNGIMSAIDFSVSVDRVTVNGVDRVVITLDGKFLPYSYNGKYPW
ncbi:MAG TPA: cyanase [Tissierellia bacterium]|jgi:cyanate lyase|nr:cyanase [Tissierellia bacterium]